MRSVPAVNRRKRKPLENLVLVSQIGLSMFIPIIGSMFLGKYLDSKFSTGNIFLLIFIVLGALTAFRNLFVIGKKSGSTRKDD